MSGSVHDVLMGALPRLRHEPTAKRVRAVLGGTTVVDTRRALLVWEPRRLVASWAVPEEDLAGSVVLDFAAFDEWWEEDARNVAHPRDPFHRIDVLPSSRSVRLEFDGTVLASSDRPTLLFETMLPTRFYLRPEEVAVPLHPSTTTSTCAYKGQATYSSAVVGGAELRDIAWSYEAPLPEAAAVTGLVAFFDERIDVVLDGERRRRPVTPWS
jgi:uncharacterized protein (DUF427 family)